MVVRKRRLRFSNEHGANEDRERRFSWSAASIFGAKCVLFRIPSAPFEAHFTLARSRFGWFRQVWKNSGFIVDIAGARA
jgi:hypothetical protein